MHQRSTPSSRPPRAAARVTVAVSLAGALAATALLAWAGPATASDAATSADTTAATTHRTGANTHRCAPIRPELDYYEAGRVASEELNTPTSRCTTISVSNVRDPANPTDRCQTFLVGFWPLVDGGLTYTEPVTACGRHRTVLARNVPNNAHYIVIYAVDYIEPVMQRVKYRVWH